MILNNNTLSRTIKIPESVGEKKVQYFCIHVPVYTTILRQIERCHSLHAGQRLIRQKINTGRNPC